MTSIRRGSALAFVPVLLALGLSACGEDTPPVCGDVASVQAATDNLKKVNLREDGPTALSGALGQLDVAATQLKKDAKDQFQSQIAAVQTASRQLAASAEAAASAPSATSLAAVGTALTGVENAVRSLNDAVSATC